jgi:hypothetical protein
MYTNSLFLDVLFYLAFGYVVVKIVNILSLLKQEYTDVKNSIGSIRTIAYSVSTSLRNLNDTASTFTRGTNSSGLASFLQQISQLTTPFIPLILNTFTEQLRRNAQNDWQANRMNNDPLAREIFNQFMRTDQFVPPTRDVDNSRTHDTALMSEVPNHVDAPDSGSQNNDESLAN